MKVCLLELSEVNKKKIQKKNHFTGCPKKIGISDLMCVGWLSVMLNGHMIPFWNPWDLTSALEVIINFMIISLRHAVFVLAV